MVDGNVAPSTTLLPSRPAHSSRQGSKRVWLVRSREAQGHSWKPVCRLGKGPWGKIPGDLSSSAGGTGPFARVAAQFSLEPCQHQLVPGGEAQIPDSASHSELGKASCACTACGLPFSFAMPHCPPPQTRTASLIWSSWI